MNARQHPTAIAVASCLLAAAGLLSVSVGQVAQRPPADPSTERLPAILAQWEAARQQCHAAIAKAKSQAERDAAWKSGPDYLPYALRMLSLAESNPNTAEARDALLWIVEAVGSAPVHVGPVVDVQQRAVQFLLDHHADDPQVVRVGVNLNTLLSRNREALLSGLVERAASPEAQGLARLALARYLMTKTDLAEKQASALQQRGASEGAEAFRAYMRACDVAASRRRAEDLLDEVVAQYGDLPFVRAGQAQESTLRYRKTLRQTAQELLDEIRNLRIGKPLPAIDALDLDGRPLKLADYRGKVVVLVFWASWCAPCMAEVPHERELAERLKGRPFALLGVNCDEDKSAAQQAIDSQRIDWRNWTDPFTEEGEGPIANRLHVRALPSVFVVDTAGILRAKNERGESLDAVVDKLLMEADVSASE